LALFIFLERKGEGERERRGSSRSSQIGPEL